MPQNQTKPNPEKPIMVDVSENMIHVQLIILKIVYF